MNDTSDQDDGTPNSSATQNQNDPKRTSISQDNAGNLSMASLPGKGGGGATTGEADNSNSNQSSAGEVKSNVGSAGQIGSNINANINANGQGSRKSINGNGNGSGSIGKLVPIQGNNSNNSQGSGQIQTQGQGSGQSQGLNGGQCMNVCLKQMPDGSYAIILPPSFVPPSQNPPQVQQQQQQGQNQNQNQGNNLNGCVPQNLLPQAYQNMLMNCGNIGGFLPGPGQNLNPNPNFLGGLQDGTFGITDGTMGGFGMLGMGPGGPNLLGPPMGLGGQDPILTMVNGQPCLVDPLTGQTIPIGPGGLILDETNDPNGQFLGMGMGPLDLGQGQQFPLQFDFGPNGIGTGFIDQNGLNGIGAFDFGLNQGQGQGVGQGLGPSSKMPDFSNNPRLRNGNTSGPGFNTNGGLGNQYQSACDCQPLDCYLIPKGRGRDCKPRYELQCCNNTPNPNPNTSMNMNTNTACASRDRRGPMQNSCSLSCTPTPRPQMQVPLPDEFNQPGQNEQRITLIREVYHFKKSPRTCSSKKPPCPCPCPCPYSHPCPCNTQEYKIENSNCTANSNAIANTTVRDCLQCDTNSITSCRPPWSNAFSYKPSCSRKKSVWPSSQKSSGCCSNSMGLLERDRENIFSSNPRSNSVCATPIAIQLQDSCNSKRGQGQCQNQGQCQCQGQGQQRQMTQQSQTQAQPQIEIQGQDPCPNPNTRKVTCRPIKTVDCGQVYLERQKGCKAPTSLVREFLVTGGTGPDTKKYKAVVATVPPNYCFRTSNILEDGNSQVTCLPSDVQQALINCGLIGNLLGPVSAQPNRAQSLTFNGFGGALAQQNTTNNNNNNRGSRSGSGAGVGPGNQNQNQGGRRSRNNSKSAGGGLGLGNERSMSGKINEIVPPSAIGMEQDMNNLNPDESMNFDLDLNDTNTNTNTTNPTTTTTKTNIPTNDKKKASTLAIMNKSNTNANANTTRKTSLIDSQPPRKKESLAGDDVSKKKSASRKNSMIQ